jgi:hypothetical protein
MQPLLLILVTRLLRERLELLLVLLLHLDADLLLLLSELLHLGLRLLLLLLKHLVLGFLARGILDIRTLFLSSLPGNWIIFRVCKGR